LEANRRWLDVLHYVHYGERQHVDNFFKDGSIQIGTVRSYDTATHGLQIGDDDEGYSYSTLTDHSAAKLRAEGRPLPSQFDWLFNSPGASNNKVFTRNVGFNYAMFCVSHVLHRDLCQIFKPTYAAAIYIERPFPFFAELTKAFQASGLTEEVTFEHVADVDYRSRQAEHPDELTECFVKDERYTHQAEARAIWNVGENPPPFFRFKAPDAVRCCRIIPLDEMPDYKPGSDDAVVQAQIIKAIGGLP
jgi:hypothetical protein